MIINLLELRIKNFKGIDEFYHQFSPGITEIRGKNETFKTTLADAYAWLMQGSDSEGRGNFNQIKLNEFGMEIPHQDADVSAKFDAKGVHITFQKIHRQRWVKERGKAKREFSGHTTDYYINGRSVRKKDYDAKIEEVADIKKIRMLSDVRYFIEKTSVDCRRAILMKLCDVAPDEQLINANPKFNQVGQIMAEFDGLDVELIKAELSRRSRKINEKLKDFPKLINENKRNISAISDSELSSTVQRVNEIDALIADHRKRIYEIETGGAAAIKRSEILAVENTIAAFEIKRNLEISQLESNGAKSISDINSDISKIQQKIASLKNKKLDIAAEFKRTDESLDTLKARWADANKAVFIAQTICDKCGAPIDPEKIAENKVHFQNSNAEKIKQLNILGRDMTAKRKELEFKIGIIDSDIQGYEEIVEKLTIDLGKAKVSIDTEREACRKKYAALADPHQTKKAALSNDLASLSENSVPEKEKFEAAIYALETEKKPLKARLAEVDASNKSIDRIKELELLVKKNSAEYEKIEGQILILENFEQFKAELIEENVSQHFRITRWKLFERQINGGLKPICEPTYRGIPYSTDLNNGAKINVGLDIIMVLSRLFNVVLPVWIDNAESVTDDLVNYDHQLIKLIVDEDYKKLTVVKVDEDYKELSVV